MDLAGNPTVFEGAVKPSSIEVDAYEPNIFAHRYTPIETNQQARWVYDTNGNVTYAGYAPSGLDEGSVDGHGNPTGWLLQQLTYTATTVMGATEYLPTKRLIAYGNWTNYLSATYL